MTLELKLSLSFWETMINTWIVMAVLVGISAWITRDLRVNLPLTRKQHALEIAVELIRDQIGEIEPEETRRYVPFIGTLFLFIATANVLSVLPSVGDLVFEGWSIYQPPTASVETPVALALYVLLAVPYFSIRRRGVRHWLRTYIQPSPLLLPFNLLGELTRTLALAARLFGNMMSGTVMAAVLISIIPFFFPVVMQVFGLVTGTIQAYIFGVLSMVYIASAVQIEKRRRERIEQAND